MTTYKSSIFSTLTGVSKATTRSVAIVDPAVDYQEQIRFIADLAQQQYPALVRDFWPSIARDRSSVSAHEETNGTPRFDGSFDSESEGLFFEDGFFIQFQNYAVSQYLSIAGPTLVRFVTTEDFELFLADADNAKATGNFPAFLTHPLVHLADQVSLRSSIVPLEGNRERLFPPRAFLRPDGTVSTSPFGRTVSRTADGPSGFAVEWAAATSDCHSCPISLAGVVPEEHRRSALDRRPWLGHYIDAVSGLRDACARNILDLRIWGFGDGEEGSFTTNPRAVVLHSDGVALVHLAAENRTLRIAPEAVELAALLIGERRGAAEDRFPIEAVNRAWASLAAAGLST